MKGPGGSTKKCCKTVGRPHPHRPPNRRTLAVSALFDSGAAGRNQSRKDRNEVGSSRAGGHSCNRRRFSRLPATRVIRPAIPVSKSRLESSAISPRNPVRLEGHTDSNPIHTPRYRNNWELSAARSIAMLDVLSARFQIPADRFSVAGYADTAPVASNDTEEGRARNRHVRHCGVLNRAAAVPDVGPKLATIRCSSATGSEGPKKG